MSEINNKHTGRTTRLLLRAIHGLFALPEGTSRSLVVVVVPGSEGEVLYRVFNTVLAVVFPAQMDSCEKEGTDIRLVFNWGGQPGLQVGIRVVPVGTDLRGRPASVICVDHAAEELIDALPSAEGWDLLQVPERRVFVRGDSRITKAQAQTE